YGKTLLVSFAAGVPVLVLDKWLDTSFGIGLIWKIMFYFLSVALLFTVTGICKKEDWLSIGKIIGLKSIIER
ncbi:MAG: hypothetical protein O6943_13030, partial [Bacteroidetes bacterium]|nr:hypothetical protein [Bacteroidota bacterium]